MAELKIKVPRKQIEAFCKKNHIRKLAFFGSVLREDFGMRNRLIHGYDEVDFDFLWRSFAMIY
jgi:uncharacterized protein YutE (UPF0331/DUF86 family)